MATADQAVIQPLNFSHSPAKPPGVDGPIASVQCLFCADVYDFPAKRDDYLAHLYLQHHLIISDVSQVAILVEYLQFWRCKFEDVQFDAKQYCTTMLLDSLPDGRPAPATEYFLLDDTLPADRIERIRLHKRRLDIVLTQHQMERTDCQYQRACLFCRDTCQPSRAATVEHLFQKHYLHLGRPQNLVYIDELIDDVRDKLARLVCLFCAKTFKDRPTLKEHMRKKGHKRINPDDKQYDKFYMVNYTKDLPASTTSANAAAVFASAAEKHVQKSTAIPSDKWSTNDGDSPEHSDSDWSDWEETDGDQSQTMCCLYCKHSAVRYAQLAEHIQTEHGVDLVAALAPLTFHKKFKLLTYVRKRMHENTCVTCEHVFADAKTLTEHLATERHYGTGRPQQWDQPNFFIPLYENDPLLFCLDDEDDDDALANDAGAESEEDGVQIFAEEISVAANRDAEELSREFKVSIQQAN